MAHKIRKTQRKVLARLDARIKGHHEAVAIAKKQSQQSGAERGFRQPGSRNPNKAR